jgi:hypothetical protein
MFCRNCGQPIASCSEYCSFCGTPTGDKNTRSSKYAQKQTGKPSGAGVAVLVCGILALVFFWTLVPGIVLGAIALILGIYELKRSSAAEKGKVIAGIVTGLVALALCALLIALIVWSFYQIPDLTGLPLYSM